MSTENTVAPVAETLTPATEPAESSTLAGAEPTTGADPVEKPEKTAEQRELDMLRRKATKAERNNFKLSQERDEIRTRLESLERTTPKQEVQKVPVDPNELNRYVQTRAQEIAKGERLQERVNSVIKAGQKDFPDFDAMTAAMVQELPVWEGPGKPSAVMEALLEMDNPSALVHYLGKNPEIASELADLSPIALTRRLDKIERDMKPNRQPASTPRPLKPVEVATASSEPDIKDTARWIKWKNKQDATP